MSILTKLFSGGAADLVKGVGGVLDDLTTSKEEKLEAERKIKELQHQNPVAQELQQRAYRPSKFTIMKFPTTL